MGKQTHNFRQTARSISGNLASQGYAKINRMGSWYGKMNRFFPSGIISLVKVRGEIGGNCCGKS